MFFQTHNILTTKARLKKCRQAIDETCNYCKEREDLIHIFNCSSFAPVAKWFLRKLGTVDPTTKDVDKIDIFMLNFKITDNKIHNNCVWMVAKFVRAMWLQRKADTIQAQILPEIINSIKKEAVDLRASRAYAQCRAFEI